MNIIIKIPFSRDELANDISDFPGIIDEIDNLASAYLPKPLLLQQTALFVAGYHINSVSIADKEYLTTLIKSRNLQTLVEMYIRTLVDSLTDKIVKESQFGNDYGELGAWIAVRHHLPRIYPEVDFKFTYT